MGNLFTAFKEFVPGKVMIVVLVFVSLAGAAYLMSANNRGEHLTRRNFHSLNAMAENIEASLSALDAVVEFAEPACQWEPDPKAYATCIRNYVGEAGTRLSGGIVSKVQLLEPTGEMKNLALCTTDEELSDNTNSIAFVNHGSATLNGKLIRKEYFSGIKGNSCHAIIIDYDVLESSDAREGFFDTTLIADYTGKITNAPVISNTAASGLKVSPDNIRQLFNVATEPTRLRTLQELALAAAKQRAQSFTLSIEGAEFKEGDDLQPQPFAQSTITPLDIGDRSFYAFVQPMDLHAGINNDLVIVGLVSQTRFNQEKYQLPYNLLYGLLLLLLTAGLIISLVHLAMIGKRELLHRKNTLLANFSLLGLQAIFVVIITQAWSVYDFNQLFSTSKAGLFDAVRRDFDRELTQHLARMEQREHLLLKTRNASVSLSDCSFDGDGIVWAVPGWHQLPPGQVQQPCQPNHILNKQVEQRSLLQRDRIAETFSTPKIVEDSEGEQVRQISIRSAEYRGVENYFLLNQFGEQVGTYVSNKTRPAKAGFQVRDRHYFTQVRDGNAWTYRTRSGEKSRLDGTVFFLDRIESKIDGAISTVISTTANPELQPDYKACTGDYTGSLPPDEKCARQKPIVMGYTTHFNSLRHTALPAGFGFAVFDNISGKVLFHSLESRSLRENFYQATDDDDLLKARVIAAAPSLLHMKYKGENIEARVGPLKQGIPWTLVVYFRSSVPDVVSFHFGVTGGLLAMLHLLVAAIAVALLVTIFGLGLTPAKEREAFRWRKLLQLPQWMCPLRKRIYEYRLLNMYFFGVIPVYIGVVYYLDHLLWFWYFVISVLSVAVWHRLIRYELYSGDRVLPPKPTFIRYITPVVATAVALFAIDRIARSGAYGYSLFAAVWMLAAFSAAMRIKLIFNSELPRKGLTVYRRAVTLFGIVTVILPTMLLLNHNYDIHERLWVHFTNWATVDRLKARHNALKTDARGVHLQGSLTQTVLNQWTGVYLPRTEIFSLRDEQALLNKTRTLTATRHTNPSLLTAGERSEYYNAYLLARTAADRNSVDDLIAIDDGSIELSFFDKSGQARSSFSLPRMIARWSPNLSDIGDLIESYDERSLDAPEDRTEDAPEDSAVKAQHTGTKLERKPRPIFISRVDQDGQLEPWKIDKGRSAAVARIVNTPYLGGTVYREIDDRAQLEYRILNWYPHTRSLKPVVDLFALLGFVVIPGFIFWGFNCWLTGRFFSDAFEDDLLTFPRNDRRYPSPATSSGIIVVPPGTNPEDLNYCRDSRTGESVFGELSEVAPLPANPGPWRFEFSPQQNAVIAWLVCDVLNDSSLPRTVLDSLIQARHEHKVLVIVSDLDLRYALTETYRTQTVDENENKALSDELFREWRAFLSDFDTYLLSVHPIHDRAQSRQHLWKAWEKCNLDERMALAGMFYEDRTNPKNHETLTSLYRRGLIQASNYGFRFCRPSMTKDIVRSSYPIKEFLEDRRRYENSTWLTWKKPIIVVMTLLMVFILFVARDQISGIFSLFATVLTGLATIGLISERIREFGAVLLGKGG
jgi:hypothetical protein